MVFQRRLASITMKQIFRHCAGYRIDWAKLFFAGAIMTVAGVMLQMFTLPYPLSMWFISQPVISWDEPLNGEVGLSERVTKSMVTNVFLSSPAELSLSVPVEPAERLTVTERRKSVSRRRRKDTKADAKLTVSPPPPPSRRSVPYRLQVQIKNFNALCFNNLDYILFPWKYDK